MPNVYIGTFLDGSPTSFTGVIKNGRIYSNYLFNIEEERKIEYIPEPEEVEYFDSGLQELGCPHCVFDPCILGTERRIARNRAAAFHRVEICTIGCWWRLREGGKREPIPKPRKKKISDII